MEHSCRLLFVDEDFSKTDVGSVLWPRRNARRDRMRQLYSIRLRIWRFDSKLGTPHVRIGSCSQPPRCAQPQAFE